MKTPFDAYFIKKYEDSLSVRVIKIFIKEYFSKSYFTISSLCLFIPLIILNISIYFITKYYLYFIIVSLFLLFFYLLNRIFSKIDNSLKKFALPIRSIKTYRDLIMFTRENGAVLINFDTDDGVDELLNEMANYYATDIEHILVFRTYGLGSNSIYSVLVPIRMESTDRRIYIREGNISFEINDRPTYHLNTSKFRNYKVELL